MKTDLKKWKKPIMAAILVTAAAYLTGMFLVRCSGWILAPFLGEYAPVFRQLLRARIEWEPLWVAALLSGCACVFYLTRRRKTTAAILAPVCLAVCLLTMRVNSVPLRIAIQAAAVLLG